MAVKRVFGRVDGVEVVLQWAEGNRWSVPVPLDQDGEYVVEIIAEDEAGNQSYMAKMLFVVNTALLCVHVIPVPYFASLIDSKHCVRALNPQYVVAQIAQVYSLEPAPPTYYTEIIEPVCTLAGRR